MHPGELIPATLAEYKASAAEVFSQPQDMAQRMDEAAFQIFYRDTAPMLWSYIRRASGDAALADDILQETFLRILRASLPAMENVQMKAYLYRTASSLLVDHWRCLKRERRWSLGSWFGGEPAPAPNRAVRPWNCLRVSSHRSKACSGWRMWKVSTIGKLPWRCISRKEAFASSCFARERNWPAC